MLQLKDTDGHARMLERLRDGKIGIRKAHTIDLTPLSLFLEAQRSCEKDVAIAVVDSFRFHSTKVDSILLVSNPFHFGPFVSIPFESTPFQSIPFESIPFHCLPVPLASSVTDFWCPL